MIIERIYKLPDDIHLLLEESLEEQFVALKRLQESYIDGANTFSLPGEALFSARVGGELVGICGLNIDPYQESSKIGRVRHLYVAKAHRLNGIGRKLISEIEAFAQASFSGLQLYTDDQNSGAFYVAIGYKKGGVGKASHVKQFKT
jgi:GNAT superfamily N-acetyltransferase